MAAKKKIADNIKKSAKRAAASVDADDLEFTPSKKPTAFEYERRIRRILRLQLNGHSRPSIHQHASKWWGVSDGAIDVMIAKAKERLLAINEADTEHALAQVTGNLWELYRKAKESKEHGLAASILGQIGRIKGLDKQKVEHSGSVTLADLVLEAKKKETSE